MNDTKWTELQKAVLEELPFPPPYQRKDVLSTSAEPQRFDADVSYHGDWREGLLPFRSIEWIRIRPRYLRARGALVPPSIIDCADQLIAILRNYNIPYVERDKSIWVFGYR